VGLGHLSLFIGGVRQKVNGRYILSANFLQKVNAKSQISVLFDRKDCFAHVKMSFPFATTYTIFWLKYTIF